MKSDKVKTKNKRCRALGAGFLHKSLYLRYIRKLGMRKSSAEMRTFMKVLIVSYTHRRNDNYIRVLEKVAPVDLVIHCGDIEGSEYLIAERAGCPVHMVVGNNDFFSDLPREKEFEIGKYKVWLTHGHNYYVSMSNENIKHEARMREVDIVMYGHTHKPVVDIDCGVTAVNPGSLTFPRQEGKRPSFIIMDLDKNGDAHFTINFL
ncbi:putative metallophosphoesterase MG207 [Lachnospiraceae bacterium]|nr:putative metallophosphoesterase MG207 [Lachnospiraceae bacterium]